MIEFSHAHFEELCRSAPVAGPMRAMEETRREALRKFWLYLIGGIALAVAAGWSLFASGWEAVAVILAMVILIGAIILAWLPLSRASEGLKHPVLETLAGKGGMDYLPTGFDPPVYPEARGVLFGKWLSGESFTDLFHGADPEGRRFAVYEASLTRKSGKSTVTVFTGQVYAFQRRGRGGGAIAIVPDRGLFNFFKPARGMERVRFDGDPEFEKKFEVYAEKPHEALALLGSHVRRQLLELRRAGRVLGYVGPEDALVAVWGKNRFEPGSMFRSRSGEERVRLMFDDLCASLAVLRGLRASLG